MLEPPDVPDELRHQAKKQLRSRMRALRAAHPQAALDLRSLQLVNRLTELASYQGAASIALFWPLPHEVDLRSLDAHARSRHKRVYYPVMDPIPAGFSTGFALTRDSAELRPGNSRFFEPPADAPRAARGEIELIVVPALAVSALGQRLGYGAGFYDVTLPDFRPPARCVVVAYDFQLLAELPSEPHDVICDAVVTDRRSLEI